MNASNQVKLHTHELNESICSILKYFKVARSSSSRGSVLHTRGYNMKPRILDIVHDASRRQHKSLTTRHAGNATQHTNPRNAT